MRKAVVILLAIIPLVLISCHKEVNIRDFDIVQRDINIKNTTGYDVVVEVKGERYRIFNGSQKVIPDTAWAWDWSTRTLVYTSDSIVVELDTTTMQPGDEYFRVVHRRSVVDSVVSYEPALHNLLDGLSYSLSVVEVSVDEERRIRHCGTIDYYVLTAYDVNPTY